MPLNINDIQFSVEKCKQTGRDIVYAKHVPSGFVESSYKYSTEAKNKSAAVDKLEARFAELPEECLSYSRFEWIVRSVEPQMEYDSKWWNWYKEEGQFWIESMEKRAAAVVAENNSRQEEMFIEVEPESEIFTVKKWIGHEKDNTTGHGYWAKSKKLQSFISCFDPQPEWATHVIWYNHS